MPEKKKRKLNDNWTVEYIDPPEDAQFKYAGDPAVIGLEDIQFAEPPQDFDQQVYGQQLWQTLFVLLNRFRELNEEKEA